MAADRVIYEGDSGPGKGKHILFIASDHEYRGEETCPAIARIMAKRYGFKCTVLFAIDPETGYINPNRADVLPGVLAGLGFYWRLRCSHTIEAAARQLSWVGIGRTARTAQGRAAVWIAGNRSPQRRGRALASIRRHAGHRIV